MWDIAIQDQECNSNYYLSELSQAITRTKGNDLMSAPKAKAQLFTATAQCPRQRKNANFITPRTFFLEQLFYDFFLEHMSRFLP